MATLVAVNPALFSYQTTPNVVKVYAATSVAWNPGEFIRINSSGEAVAITDAAVTGGVKYQAITRRVAADAAGFVDVLKIRPDYVFKGHVKSGTVSEANLGIQYILDVTSNITTVDTGTTTNGFAEIVGLGYQKDPSAYSSADTVAVVYFRILTSTIDAAAAA